MIYIKKIYCKWVLAIFLVLGICFATSRVVAIKPYQKVDFSTGLVTASTLNVRSGPSTAYGIVTRVNKNEYIRVFAQVGTWYIIQTESDYIGAVSKEYVKPIYPNSSGNTGANSSNTNQNTNTTANLTADEKETFELINAQRVKARVICSENRTRSTEGS